MRSSLELKDIGLFPLGSLTIIIISAILDKDLKSLVFLKIVHKQ